MTQDLIKQMREQYAREQEQKVIEQPIEQVVINPAPTADATNTPQDVLNRTVAVITKVNEKITNIDLSHKQDTLTRTLTLVLDDGTTTNIKVG